MYNPPKPIPVKNRVSFVFLEYGLIDVKDGAFVLIDKNGVRTQVPLGDVTCLMLEPGTRISHAAVALAAKAGTLIMWVGEGGVRLYSAGQPGGARSDRLLWQAATALDDSARLKVVRKMYEMRFGEKPPAKRSVEQLRGIEGARVRAQYKMLATQHGVKWDGRKYDPKDWDTANPINRCLSVATSCLYGLCEAAILACGFAPAIGFIHTGKPQSFVYDIADIFKFDTVVPAAFRVAKRHPGDIEGAVRRECRDSFRTSKILNRIVPVIDEIIAAGEMPLPGITPEQVGPALPNGEQTGDAGHRT
ncbi:MAG: type I-E CRISPR-associated endonuclease Cas1e [bacterium]